MHGRSGVNDTTSHGRKVDLVSWYTILTPLMVYGRDSIVFMVVGKMHSDLLIVHGNGVFENLRVHFHYGDDSLHCTCI